MPLLNEVYSADNIDDAIAYVGINNPACTELDLSSKELTDDNVIDLCVALAQNPHIVSLNLWGNHIGDEGAAALAENTTLTSLNLEYNFIGSEGAVALAEDNTTLTSLNVGRNEIGAEGAVALADNTTLTSLDVCCNEIGDEGAAALAGNTTLTSLNVLANSIGCYGYDYGVEALAENTTLRSLNLGANNIGDDGAEAFAFNDTLTSLTIDDNNIGNDGADAFAEYNTTLTFLSIANNEIDDDLLRMLNQVIQLNGERASLLLGCIILASMTRVPAPGILATPLPIDVFSHIVSFSTTNQEERERALAVAVPTFFQHAVPLQVQAHAPQELAIRAEKSSDEEDDSAAKRQRIG